VPKHADAKFLAAVESKKSQVLAASTAFGRARAIASLKKHYDATFGKGSKNRNIISLFLYSGPSQLRGKSICVGTAEVAVSARCCDWDYPLCWCYSISPDMVRFGRDRTGFLYSGDGYVEKPFRWDALRKYFGASRVDKLVGFQVMHHGAKANWYPGLANAIRPSVSVFSSDPARGPTFHPHKTVETDFQHYRPVYAGIKKGVRICALYV
jgi:hypothetical protein